ncbi:MAG: S-formylglutathione hydrolase [Gammaproteobacteria bacterium]|nr:S-formylglutathione hydrolase [Gammaproteobacteria bacterium]MBV9726399.1 S-formylglutathione hydrolase [Gammaproteobacteria bacterium]
MLETISEHKSFDGIQGFYRHQSAVVGLPMRFAVFQPPQARQQRVPVLFYLAGLTCTEETFAIKAGAQRVAAREGLMLVTCDTSPRQTGIPGESDDWEVGSGAGFYVNATQSPWARYFRMYDYVLGELRETVLAHFPAVAARCGIFGHSMGGHGALVLALRNPQVYRSVSAFAPICSPSRCPWGRKAFTRYLGEDQAAWASYDAVELLTAGGARVFPEILVDQGLADKFLPQGQLLPELLEQACAAVGQPLRLRRQEGYGHDYYFIATFIEDHLRFHAQALGAQAAA